jgi:hypothetical protein
MTIVSNSPEEVSYAVGRSQRFFEAGFGLGETNDSTWIVGDFVGLSAGTKARSLAFRAESRFSRRPSSVSFWQLGDVGNA